MGHPLAFHMVHRAIHHRHLLISQDLQILLNVANNDQRLVFLILFGSFLGAQFLLQSISDFNYNHSNRGLIAF